jgi:hypothetical protein
MPNATTRVFANALVNTAWRNGSVEDMPPELATRANRDLHAVPGDAEDAIFDHSRVVH